MRGRSSSPSSTKDWVLFNVPLLQKSSMRKLSSRFIALGTEECFRGVLHLHHSTPVLSSANQFEFAKPRGLSLECLCCWQGHHFYMDLDFFRCLERWYEHWVWAWNWDWTLSCPYKYLSILGNSHWRLYLQYLHPHLKVGNITWDNLLAFLSFPVLFLRSMTGIIMGNVGSA